MSVFDYKRRPTHEVMVGEVPLGASNPIRIQSMASTPTMDTDASVAQCLRIVGAGAEYVRFTAQGVREAENLGEIRRRLRAEKCNVPLVADIHFNPKAAFAAAKQVEKVRINPGNFVDPGRTFRKIEYTDEEYTGELGRIEGALVPFLELCRQNSTAIRIGVNHGSLSDRIMSRYGDTPAGMVESAMEFLRVCVRHSFFNVVVSIKASNVCVMVETVRRLVGAMDDEGMHFPLHLGVTEAGDGEDGRIKSAVGIGALLAEGIGDTIRVSLSEEPENELPVAEAIVSYVAARSGDGPIGGKYSDGYDPKAPSRRVSVPVCGIGGDNKPIVVGCGSLSGYGSDNVPDFVVSDLPRHVVVDASTPVGEYPPLSAETLIVLQTSRPNYTGVMQAALHSMVDAGIRNPVILRANYDDCPSEEVPLRAAVDMGTLLLNGFSDGIWIESSLLPPHELSRISFGILQSVRQRFTRTEYIACPGCGRTLFNLQATLSRIKEATSHLTGLKIGVMGCIVNGPGEMADADYGYVGAGVGKVSLYKGRTCMEKNIPEEQAVDKLVDLIKSEGDWK